MKPLFFLLCLSLLAVGQVSAVSVSDHIRFNETVPAGSDVSFQMIFTPGPSEKMVTFEKIEVIGDCAAWVTVNKSRMVFTGPAPASARITVPLDATNGTHRCDISFITPENQGIQMVIGVPITVNVTGGREAPVTIAPITTEPTTEPPTTTAPPATTTPRQTYAGLEPLIVIAGIIGLITLRRMR